jgi:peptide/nickel transport system permease protein
MTSSDRSLDHPALTTRDRLDGMARFLRSRPSLAPSLVVVALVVIAALFANVVAPYPPEDGDLANRMAGPSLRHPLGTDKVGRDLLSRLIHGARGSFGLAVGAVVLSQVLAVAVGITSAYYGGWFDLALQRLIDIWIALPGLLFLIFVIGTVGSSVTVVLVVLGLLLFAGSSRVVRALTLALSETDHIEATRGLGAGSARLILRHLLPNVLPLVAVQATLQVGAAILIESSLSFLGYGVPPPTPTWGRMLADARGDLTAPGGLNLALWPGIAITVVVYAVNVVGDGLHDLLDGRVRGD